MKGTNPDVSVMYELITKFRLNIQSTPDDAILVATIRMVKFSVLIRNFLVTSSHSILRLEQYRTFQDRMLPV